MKKIFSSKANTLALLQADKILSIPPLYFFSYAEWKSNELQVINSIIAFFSTLGEEVSLAVRSSCSKEDGSESSGAGAFTSLLHIENTPSSLKQAINTVFASYKNDGMPPEDEEQVLVQLMLKDIIINGVIMTYVSDDGAPYYVINYDDDSNEADTITSGRGKTKLIYIYRDFKKEDFDNLTLYQCVEMASILEKKCGHKSIDIEFCVTADNVFHLLQVRPICTQHQWIANAEAHVQKNINYITTFLKNIMSKTEYLFGDTTFLGVMPDWNPAEMIGLTPRLLSSSLYREFITKRVWSQARELMGYRALPPDELMVLIAGRPYIDVRLSFNSFLPLGIDKTTGALLVNAWLERLNTHTYFHDKIEFEIAQTVLDFNFEKDMQARYPHVLNEAQKADYKEKLRILTEKNVSTGKDSSYSFAMAQIAKLKKIQDKHSLLTLTHDKDTANALKRIVSMTEECKLLGTLPFSILARHAFIAESFLRSAITRGALTQERYAFLKSTIKTVSTEFAENFSKAAVNKDLRDSFLLKYGHLRPSSYDITSSRYIDRQDLFNLTSEVSVEMDCHGSFELTSDERAAFIELIKEANFTFTPEDLLDYASKAIPAREYAKFIFTRHLSDILEWIAVWGEKNALSREELSFLDFRDITEWTYHALLSEPQQHFLQLVQKGKNDYDLGRSLKLSYIIRSPRDLYVAPQQSSAPNFVGHACVEAPIIRMFADSNCSESITGKIVCIENADPGFDWIFTRNIAGLITLFGGANSHMAIRCAEYGLPAAIGVGSTIFSKVSLAHKCILDTQTKRILF